MRKSEISKKKKLIFYSLSEFLSPVFFFQICHLKCTKKWLLLLLIVVLGVPLNKFFYLYRDSNLWPNAPNYLQAMTLLTIRQPTTQDMNVSKQYHFSQTVNCKFEWMFRGFFSFLAILLCILCIVMCSWWRWSKSKTGSCSIQWQASQTKYDVPKCEK